MRMKIALIGQNQFAYTVAWGICHSELAQDIVIFTGTQSGKIQGTRRATKSTSTADGVEDLTHANALSASDSDVSVTNDIEDLAESDVVVLLPTSLPYGFHSTQALKTTNLSNARNIVPKIQESIQEAIILVAMPFANYVAAWIHQTYELSNLIGIANGVATAHLKSEIASRIGLSVKDVSALAIGNDEVIHPLPQYCRVNGIPLTQLMDESQIQNLITDVAKRCQYTSANEFTLTSHILQLISAISLDKKRVMSIGTLISTDTTSVFLNVPAKIGSNGIEGIVPLELTEPQREQFKQLIAQSATEQSVK